VEDLYIEENLNDQSMDKISNPDRIKWAMNSFKHFKRKDRTSSSSKSNSPKTTPNEPNP